MLIKIIILFLLSNVKCTNDYKIQSFNFNEDNNVFTCKLKYDNSAFNPDDYHYDFSNKSSNLLEPITDLDVEISIENDKYIHLKITDSNNERWINPYGIDENYTITKSVKTFDEIGLSINAEINQTLTISLNDDSEKIFDTSNTDFLFTNYFIGFGFRLSSEDIYGFGERMHDYKLSKGKFTLWPNDTSGIREDTGLGGDNGYGIQPLGMYKSRKGKYIGLLFNNINSQDLIIDDIIDEVPDTNTILLEHRTIGGIIDYYICIEDTNLPDDILRGLHELVGKPTLPPFWSLGFHYSKWGYKNDKDVFEMYQSYKDYEIPIDTFWTDLDSMYKKRDFSLDSEKFKDLPNIIYDMHSNGYKFVPIVDIGIPQNETDEFYSKGKKENAFILSSYTNDFLVTNVWPGLSVFPDFFSESGKNLWEYGLDRYYEIIKYDGIWLDMNEPAMLISLPNCRAEYLPGHQEFEPEKNEYEYIPYVPGYILTKHIDIRTHSISENCYSHETKNNKFLYGYNFKPLLSFLENKYTYQKLKNMSKRPFILTRSTTLGTNRYSFHWLGDNFADIRSIEYGLHGTFSFNLYGIPMVGDDICGFFGKASDGLCARWMSLSSFYSFSRNHKSIFGNNHEPFAYGLDSLTYKSSKLALNIRYSLLRYYYTQLFLVSIGERGSFFKPAFFNYQDDFDLYNNYNQSAFIGDNLILFPVIKEDTAPIDVYIPNYDFAEYLTGKNVVTKNLNESESYKISLSGEYGIIHLFIKGGSIIPKQDTFNKFIPNTYYLQKEKMEIIVNPDTISHLAFGEIIYDDDGIDTIYNKNYLRIRLLFINDYLSFEVDNNFNKDYVYNKNDIFLNKISFYNINYLFNDKNYDMARIELMNNKKINIPLIKKTNFIYQVDFSKYSVKISEILTVQLYELNTSN